MTFTEEWFSVDSAAALADLAREVRMLAGRVVEVGSWEGRSTVVLADVIAPAVVNAVDTWAGSPSEPYQLLMCQRRDVYRTFVDNLRAYGTGNVVAHRTGWRDYFARDRSPIRFLFIDAEHTYDEVADNIAAARDLIVPGGVMCGDDADHPPVAQAVADTLGEVERRSALWVWRP